MKKFIYSLLGLLATLSTFAQNFTIFEQEGLKGVKNAEDKVIIKPKYTEIEQNSRNYFLVGKKQKNGRTDRWIMDSKGKEITEVQYLGSGSFANGFFEANAAKFNDGKLTVFNEDLQIVAKGFFLGEMSISGDYAFVKEFYPNYMLKNSGKIYDKQWKLVYAYEKSTPLTYITPDYVSKTLLMLKLNGKWGVFRPSDMQEIVPPVYDEIKSSSGFFFSDANIYALVKDGRTGFFNALTGQLIQADYTGFEKFKDTLYAGRYPHGMDILSKNGVKIRINQYDSVSVALNQNFYFNVWKNNKTGIVDAQLKAVVPVQFDSVICNQVYSLKDSLLVTTYDRSTSLKGLYGTQRGEIMPMQFNDILIYNDSTLLIQKNKLWGLYRNKKFVIEPEYDEIKQYSNFCGDRGTMYRVTRNNKKGLINPDTGESTGCFFNKLELVNFMDKDLGSVYLVKDTGKMLFLRGNGLKPLNIKMDSCILVDGETQQGLVRIIDQNTLFYYNIAFDKLSFPVKRIISPYKEGYARVSTDRGNIYMNTIFIPVTTDIVYDPAYNYIMLWVKKSFAKEYHISSYNPVVINVQAIPGYGEDAEKGKIYKITGGTSVEVSNWTPEDTDEEGFVIVKLEKHKKYSISGTLKPVYSYEHESVWNLKADDSTFASGNKFIQELGR